MASTEYGRKMAKIIKKPDLSTVFDPPVDKSAHEAHFRGRGWAPFVGALISLNLAKKRTFDPLASTKSTKNRKLSIHFKMFNKNPPFRGHTWRLKEIQSGQKNTKKHQKKHKKTPQKNKKLSDTTSLTES